MLYFLLRNINSTRFIGTSYLVVLNLFCLVFFLFDGRKSKMFFFLFSSHIFFLFATSCCFAIENFQRQRRSWGFLGTSAGVAFPCHLQSPTRITGSSISCGKKNQSVLNLVLFVL